MPTLATSKLNTRDPLSELPLNHHLTEIDELLTAPYDCEPWVRVYSTGLRTTRETIEALARWYSRAGWAITIDHNESDGFALIIRRREDAP